MGPSCALRILLRVANCHHSPHSRNAFHVHSREARIPHAVLSTRTLTAPASHSTIHQNIKDKIVAATEQDTIHIFRTLHNTARVFKNAVSTEVVRLERRPGGAKFDDLRDLVSGQRGRRVYETGDVDAGIWSAGVTLGLISDCPTCEELLRRIEREAEEVIAQMASCRVVHAKL